MPRTFVTGGVFNGENSPPLYEKIPLSQPSHTVPLASSNNERTSFATGSGEEIGTAFVPSIQKSPTVPTAANTRPSRRRRSEVTRPFLPNDESLATICAVAIPCSMRKSPLPSVPARMRPGPTAATELMSEPERLPVCPSASWKFAGLNLASPAPVVPTRMFRSRSSKMHATCGRSTSALFPGLRIVPSLIQMRSPFSSPPAHRFPSESSSRRSVSFRKSPGLTTVFCRPFFVYWRSSVCVASHIPSCPERASVMLAGACLMRCHFASSLLQSSRPMLAQSAPSWEKIAAVTFGSTIVGSVASTNLSSFKVKSFPPATTVSSPVGDWLKLLAGAAFQPCASVSSRHSSRSYTNSRPFTVEHHTRPD